MNELQVFGGGQEMTVIPKGDVYRPIVSSKLPKAQEPVITDTFYFRKNHPNDFNRIRAIVVDGDVWFAGVDVIRILELDGGPGNYIGSLLEINEYMLLSSEKIPRHADGWERTPQLYIINQRGALKLLYFSLKNHSTIPTHAAGVEVYIRNARSVLSNKYGSFVFQKPEDVIAFEELEVNHESVSTPAQPIETDLIPQKPARVCNKCNAETTNPEAKFCWKCGAEIKTPEQRLIDNLQSICSLAQHVPASARDKFIRTINSAVGYIKGADTEDDTRKGTNE